MSRFDGTYVLSSRRRDHSWGRAHAVFERDGRSALCLVRSMPPATIQAAWDLDTFGWP